MKKPNWKRLGRNLLAFFARTLLTLFDALGDLFSRKADQKTRCAAGSRLTVWLAVFGLTVAAAVACFPLRPSYSELEQRTLTEFPSFTASSFLNGEYFSDISTWFSDTFPFRENLVRLSSGFQQLYGFQSTTVVGSVETGDEIPTFAPGQQGGTEPLEGSASSVTPEQPTQPENTQQPVSDTQPETPSQPEEDNAPVNIEKLDALLVIDDAAYEYYNFRSAASASYISAINRAASRLNGVATVYNMIVPTSVDICVPESIRKGVNSSDQKEAISYFYRSMGSGVRTVDVYDTLARRQAAGDYLYFRTDHHWTALAAYHAYAAFTEAAGVHTANLETEFKEHVFEGFLGSFYRETNSLAMEANPDTVYAYEPVDTNAITIHKEDGSVVHYSIITDVDGWSASSKYASSFIGGDQPYSVIENPNLSDGSSILLVKESYGNCFAPFLAESYQYVYIADYRYYKEAEEGGLVELVQQKGIQDVLFLNTISTTRAERLVRLLADFIG